MRQTGKIIAILQNGKAQVSIKRASACGHDCTSCGACGAQAKPIVTEVVNNVGAKVGDSVEIESKTSRILGLACVVYMIPLVLFFAFYFLANEIFKTEGASIVCALFGLVCGVLIAIPVNRREEKNGTTSTIVRVID
ncbi:MAG: SoxR reducing system RseC family protein [Clostridia bacterium]|nr:SoxR reducing system RseC family protein [Clostridia bacterium]